MNRISFFMLAFFAATGASAHLGVGPAIGLSSGFGHPFSGLDHVAVMVAVGLWAGAKGGKALWAWPATFVVAMLCGGLMGLAHVPLPFVEPGILASVVVLGLLVASTADFPLPVGGAIITTFAVLHGHAHGVEAPETEGGLLYLAGFAVATIVLHVTGIAFALTIGSRNKKAVRFAGLACTAAGLGLIAGVL